MRFSVRKCDNAKMLERFPRPLHVKPLQEHFRKSGMRFSVRRCEQAKMQERFLCPFQVKPL
jgi:hypothetical protein